MRNVLDKIYREKTHFMFNNFFFFFENRVVYDTVSKKVEEPERPQMTQYGAYALVAG
jgi:hypothetical protein